MKISPLPGDAPPHARLQLTPLETAALRAAVGEVCYGFKVPDFNARLGGTEDEAQQLFKKLDGLPTDRQNEIVLTSKEIGLLRKAQEETIRELGPAEYETRTGVDFAFGQTLLKQFG